MEAFTILCVGVLLPFAQAQVESVVTSSGSLVTICLVCALPATALVLIWIFFFYCICKNEYDYRKIYKDLEKQERYLKRKQQRIKQARQLNASGYQPAPSQFSYQPSRTQAQYKAHPFTNIPLSSLGNRNDHTRGGPRVQRPYAPPMPHDISTPIARVPPHIGYQHLTEELRQQQQQRQLQMSKNTNTSDSSGRHTAGLSHAGDSRGYASNSTNPFSFQHTSPSRNYAGKLPAKDYPQSKQTSAHSSNNNVFGQLRTWPQFS